MRHGPSTSRTCPHHGTPRDSPVHVHSHVALLWTPLHLPATATFSPDSRERLHEQGPDAEGPWGPGVRHPVL